MARQARFGEARPVEVGHGLAWQAIVKNRRYKMKASWKKGYHSKIKADIAFNELEKIKDANGGVLTAGIVLINAKKKTCKLHNAFEWDDAKAAEEYRLVQARKMLHSIEVVYPEAPKQAPHRHYNVIKQEAKNGHPPRNVYKTTKEILADPIARDELLGNAIREAISFRKKYAELSELAGVFAALDDFVTHSKVI
jgi:hypothetical protein